MEPVGDIGINKAKDIWNCQIANIRRDEIKHVIEPAVF